MPQEPYALILEDSSYVILDGSQLPAGFDTMDDAARQVAAREIVAAHISTLEKAERPATFKDFAEPLSFLFVFALIILFIAKTIRNNPKLYDTIAKMDGGPNPEYGIGWRQDAAAAQPKPEYLTCPGNTLQFSQAEYKKVLTKYSPYFNLLNPSEQNNFIDRLDLFIQKKTFFIHDQSGFREMPILTSACAIQLSFGLQNYLLPAYPHIHIYPQEFMRTNPDICFLEGSVSGYSIYLSWKHFLKGAGIPSDGQHVGLHEMAHAYYCQNIEQHVDTNTTFRDHFEIFSLEGKAIFESEQKPGNDFYSDYALRDFQEFWAESIEIYFERPVEMKVYYPGLYAALCGVLHQDHAKRLTEV
jgi:hypothetical protein